MNKELEIERRCEKCRHRKLISLSVNYFICAKCGHKNIYDNVRMKPAMEELLEKARRTRFKNPKNN